MAKQSKKFRFDEATARRQLASDLDFVDERMRTHGGVRMLLVYRSAHEPDVLKLLPAGWDGIDERDALIRIYRTLGIGLNARMVTMMSEAWLRSIARRHGESEAQQTKRAQAIMPSQAEDRIEVVIVSTAWRDDAGKTHLIASVREIVRDEAGDYVRLVPVHGGPPDGEAMTEGWLRDVIPPVDVSPHDRETAMSLLDRMGVKVEFQSPPSQH